MRRFRRPFFLERLLRVGAVAGWRVVVLAYHPFAQGGGPSATYCRRGGPPSWDHRLNPSFLAWASHVRKGVPVLRESRQLHRRDSHPKLTATTFWGGRQCCLLGRSRLVAILDQAGFCLLVCIGARRQPMCCRLSVAPMVVRGGKHRACRLDHKEADTTLSAVRAAAAGQLASFLSSTGQDCRKTDLVCP